MRHTRIIVTHYGGPDALRVVEEECPEPKDGEVRVKVRAAGVSLPDLWYPSHQDGIWSAWWIGSATVSRESNQARSLPRCQSAVSSACRNANWVPVPSGLDAAEAVSLVLNYITAYQMLHRSAKVRPGQRALIHGAAGGVGSS